MNDAPLQFAASSPAPAIILDMQEWNVVLAGLGELPLKISRNTFEKILRQLQPQQERS